MLGPVASSPARAQLNVRLSKAFDERSWLFLSGAGEDACGPSIGDRTPG